MCGIVGAVSTKNIVPILIEGLKRLEYRGYDSCGVAVHPGGELRRARRPPRGAPVVRNAHPHFSRGPGVSDAEVAVSGGSAQAGRIALVHNGIIENHDE